MFSDASIRQVYPFRTVSESTAMPDKAYPVYFGSGSIVASVDATGMQGANNRVQDSFSGSPEAADMYVVGHGMVGDTLNPNNTVPFGWLDYDAVIDGERFDTAAILGGGGVLSAG